jgi:hypothetical protein
MKSAISVLELMQQSYFTSTLGENFSHLHDLVDKHLTSSKYTSEKMERILAAEVDYYSRSAEEAGLPNYAEVRRRTHQQAIELTVIPLARLRESGRYSRYEQAHQIRLLETIRKHSEPAVIYWIEKTLSLKSKYSKELSKDIFDKISQVKFGSLPFSSFNAFALGGPGYNDHVIVFHSGLIRFVARISRILNKMMWILPRDQHDAIDWRSENWTKQYEDLVRETLNGSVGKKISEQFISVVDEYFLFSGPFEFDLEFFQDESWEMSINMAVGCEIFVMCHEYAHILNGDFEKLRPIKQKHRKVDVQRYNPSHDMEHKADIVSASIVMQAIHKFVLPPEGELPDEIRSFLEQYYLLGIDLFFVCAMLIESFGKLYDVPDVIRDSHPDPSLRAAIVQRAIQENAGPGLLPFVEKLRCTVRPLQAIAWTHLQERKAEAAKSP